MALSFADSGTSPADGDKKNEGKMDKKQTRILIVDDQETERFYLNRLIQHLGYISAFHADDGNSALYELREGGIDIVITDLIMGDMEGHELVAAMKGDPTLSEIPIILVTGDPDWEGVAKAKELGVVGCLEKPVNIEELALMITKALESRGK